MKILSIDTSSPICAVAILEDTKLIKEILLNNGLTHSEKLMPIISKILIETNLKLNDIDLIVCDKGPGSFTGIRIGIATTKAFSDSLNIKSIGISSLEALCYNVKTNGFICSLINAKNENAYFGVFKNDNGIYNLVFDFSTDNIFNILNKLKELNSPITFVGDGSIEFRDLILNVLPDSSFAENNELSAFNLGLAGFYCLKNNNKSDLSPLYLRKPKAEQFLEEKVGK